MDSLFPQLGKDGFSTYAHTHYFLVPPLPAVAGPAAGRERRNIACADSSSNAGSTTSGSSSSSSTAKHFKVGDQVKVGDTWVVTVNSATTHGATDMDQPKSGDTYLVLDISFKNISSKEQDLSTLLQVDLKDSTGQKYDETIVTFVTGQPDGKIQAGSVNRGQAVYEIPSSQKSFTLGFQGDITSSGETFWDINL